MLVPEVEVKTIREVDDVGVDAGVGVGVGTGIGVELGVVTDVDVGEGVLVEGMGVLVELDCWLVVMEEVEGVEELGKVEVVVDPPPNMLPKALVNTSRGLSGDIVVPKVEAPVPPSKPPNPFRRTK